MPPPFSSPHGCDVWTVNTIEFQITVEHKNTEGQKQTAFIFLVLDVVNVLLIGLVKDIRNDRLTSSTQVLLRLFVNTYDVVFRF